MTNPETLQNRPIGVFDSGVGGLTVVRALMERLPLEHLIYYGDTARVPYGVKSRATIETYSAQIVEYLLAQRVKALVIACNTIAADANKLLVPTYPHQNEGESTEDYQRRVQKDYYDVSSIGGIFKSFGDAPGGFKEELEEINLSVGAEYVYHDQFSVRAGYHHESANKGNRKYFTVGAGFKMSAFTLDAGYVIATAKSNPLDQTMRFSLTFDMDGLKDLFKRR